MKRVLITGAGGMAGRALSTALQSKALVVALSHSELDIACEDDVKEAIAAHRPDVIFNCAAYTRVDQAEDEPDAAHRANVEGPRLLAREASRMRCRLVHLSTDYVFDGEKRRPYCVDDPVAPLGVYAQTKADGEKAVLGTDSFHLVIRVAWLFMTGGRTFLCRLKDLILREETLRVADDREGPSTYAPDFAAAAWELSEKGVTGIAHFTNTGSCSWHGFAEALMAKALELGLPVRTRRLERISSRSLSMKAARPDYSVLDLGETVNVLGREPRHWRETLVDFLREKG